MESVWRDLRLATRNLLKSRGFTAAVLLCLALGMGASIAIFSIVDAVLLRPLPYAEPERVVMVWNQFLLQDLPKETSSAREFLDVRDQATVFDGVAALAPQLITLTGVEEPQQLMGVRASASVFPVLGVKAALGRVYSAEEDQVGRHTVVVLSHQLWEERFGAQPGVVGHTLTLEGQPYVVVGVLPPEVRGFGGLDIDVWLPQALPQTITLPRTARFMDMVARLKPGVSLVEAQAEMDVVARRFQQEHPADYPANSGWGIHLVPVQEDLVGGVRRMLLALFAAVGLVLLIACANVANLLLVRATVRKREVALRLALGSSRGRLVRQFLTEGVLLSLVGAALGVLLAWWATRVLVAINPGNIPRLAEVGIHPRILLFALALALATGIVFGLVPALGSSGRGLHGTLQEGGRSGAAGAAGRRTRDLLVVAEIALALAVLVGAGLMLASLRRLLAVDPGFNPDNLLTMQLSLPRSRYAEHPQLVAFYRQLGERLQKIPGTAGVSLSSQLPMGGLDTSGDVILEGRTLAPDEAPPLTGWRRVSPGYFRTLGIPLLSGRTFTEADDEESPFAVVVDEALARRLWPGESPLGKRLKLTAHTPELSDWRTVVGVVGHVRFHGLADAAGDQLYMPVPQYPSRVLYLALRTRGAPESAAPLVREAIWSIDRDLPVLDVQSMRQRLQFTLAQPRLSASLFGSFAASALTLTLLGVYAVMAFSVVQRTRDLGIRMALGAGRQDVVRLVVRQALALIAAGVALGLVAAWALSRSLLSLLYEAEAIDVTTFAGVSLLLVALALAATYLPARRASRVDPLVALRFE